MKIKQPARNYPFKAASIQQHRFGNTIANYLNLEGEGYYRINKESQTLVAAFIVKPKINHA
jgi:hypothetical protein